MNDTKGGTHRVRGLIGIAVLISVTGCGIGLNRGAAPPQHYVLGGAPSRVDAGVIGDSTGLSIGLRRPQIASYLDAPFIVVRRGPNQIGFSELHRWGEDLGGGINRAVAGDLSAQDGIRFVATAPWAPTEVIDYLVQFNVLRFEGLTSEVGEPINGEVHLLATWEVLRPEDGVVVARGTTDHRESGWTVGDYAGLVTRLDAGLRALSEELAAGIEALRIPGL